LTQQENLVKLHVLQDCTFGGCISMGTHVLLLVKNQLARKCYEQAIQERSVTVDTVATLDEMIKAVRNTPYNGVLVDVLSKSTGTPEEKEQLCQIMGFYPVARLRWNRQTNEISLMLFVSYAENEDALDFFLKKQCKEFKPRKMRCEKRVPLHFNILLTGPNGSDQCLPEQVFTVDVSRGGCYIYSGKDWHNQKQAQFVIKELKDQTPIIGEIRRSIAWGEPMKIPGIGITFQQITAAQRQEFDDCIR